MKNINHKISLKIVNNKEKHIKIKDVTHGIKIIQITSGKEMINPIEPNHSGKIY
jgi:hypothetical protein